MNTKIQKILIIFSIIILLFSTLNFAEAWYTKIGELTFFVSVHTHYVGGCIGAVIPHVNLGVNKGSQELVNLHIAQYQKGGSSCLGIYSTGKVHFCWNICWGNYWTWLYYIALAISICLAAYLIYLSWSILVWIARVALSFIF